MLTIRTSAQISTNRHRAGFRFSPASTGAPAARGASRPAPERIRLLDAEARRFWLENLWSAHLGRVRSKRARTR